MNHVLQKTIVLTVLLLASFLSATADDGVFVNIYTISAESDRSFSLADVDKFVLKDDAMDVVLHDESVTTIMYSDFYKLTFGVQDATLDINQIESDAIGSISISYHPGDCTLLIESTSSISIVSIYNMQGRMMLTQSPHTSSVSLSVSDYPTGIYIVQVSDGDSVKTHKFVKH